MKGPMMDTRIVPLSLTATSPSPAAILCASRIRSIAHLIVPSTASGTHVAEPLCREIGPLVSSVRFKHLSHCFIMLRRCSGTPYGLGGMQTSF
ncbi:hypothetical protein M405DRAFT_514984 [Rhizopogon salebrosus TDB-379]|nr:hypothetical protein M405DRAFT_514984 [Rhizopogon salebrosus TDB-379]